jgi:5-methylcytosine-specific restriction endonuclease McrA
MNEPVLVLNRNFEPINVCNTQRAVGLLMVGKAEIVENGRGYIRTASSVFPRPSVIRLEHMIHRPRPSVKLTKREIFRRDHFTCQYCGQIAPHLTVDHVVPRFRGGESSWENLVTACPQCNRRKGGHTVQEAHMTLLRRPKAPVPSAEYLYGRHLRDDGCREWTKYLAGW